MGQLVPTAAIPVLPGDRYRISVENLLRFAPLIAPINAKVNVTTWWFFCPDRILFENQADWEDWITDPDASVSYPFAVTTGGGLEGKLLDHLYGTDGVPGATNITVGPIAAYTKIWDEWFRNQNITTTERHVPLTMGSNMSSSYNSILQADPYLRTWAKDYFTAALPWPQKGDSVTLPLLEAGSATVTTQAAGNTQWLDVATQNVIQPASDANVLAAGTTGATVVDSLGAVYDPNGTLVVDINAAAATINQLREAYRLQEFLELDAMGGTRYNEKIYAHFGVKVPDARLSRPELLGRWTGRMAISEVLQTSAALDDANTGRGNPLGTMGGHGISVTGGKPINFFATEHGWLIGIINVQPVPVYQQGIKRHWTRLDPMSYFWPKLQHIGEQEILNREIYRSHSDLTGTFGYTPRYAEYRYESNRVAGEMRSSLAHWHLGRIFSSDVALNEDFVYCNPSARIFNVLYTGGAEPEYSGDQIFGMVYNNVYASRLMAKYGRPML